MRIAIIGLGYVGLVSAACFAELGAEVFCIDTDRRKIEGLRQGLIPIYEPGLKELIDRGVHSGRMHFLHTISELTDKIEIIFIAVGTPSNEDGSADLSQVFDVAQAIGQYLSEYCLVVTKSTVPVGTSQRIRSIICDEFAKRAIPTEYIDVASNPEFLKEGAAIEDFMRPDRVVVGVESQRARELMTRLYRPILLNNFRVLFMDIASAEMTKYAANAMLATRISFINEIANLCEQVGADINQVRLGVGSDHRIGSKFLYAGCGYGGSCFPKDVKALIHTGKEYGIELSILTEVERVNQTQKHKLFNHFSNFFGGNIAGKKVAVWGLAFKPGTDDMREAPSITLIESLLDAQCQVIAYDPVAMPEARKHLSPQVQYATDIYESVLDADAIFHVTEWKEFRMPSWELLRRAMRTPLLLDGRNVFGDTPTQYGFTQIGIGTAIHRPNY